MGVEVFAAGEQLPHQPRIFIGQRDRGDIGTTLTPEVERPLAKAVVMAGRDLQGGAGAMDQQGAEIAVALFGDAEQHRLAAGGVLTRDEAQVGGERAASGELAGVADFGHHRGGGQWAHSHHLSQAPAALIPAADERDLAVELSPLLFEQSQLLETIAYHQPHRGGEPRGFGCQFSGFTPQRWNAAAQRDAVFGQ